MRPRKLRPRSNVVSKQAVVQNLVVYSSSVIAHPTGASASRPAGVASTVRSSVRTDRPLAFAVLTTERKAA